MSRSKSSRQWLARQAADPYVKEAQRKGLRSRAAFKLMEIQEKYRLFKPNMNVLDLGAAPGGFSQVATDWIEPNGKVIAIDLLEMPSLAGVEFIQGDMTDEPTIAKLESIAKNVGIDLVMSDMAPNISGNNTRDQAVAMLLCETAWALACDLLPSGGAFVVKVFQGRGFDSYLADVRSTFDKVVTFKPKSSRAQSKELYIVATGFKSS